MDKGKCGNWTGLVAWVAAVTAMASTPALADKGGEGRALGVPDINLGLPKINRSGAGAGLFVPAPQLYLAPGLMRGPLGNGNVPGAAAPGASALTPSHGLTPPGQRATPGLRLGQGYADGATRDLNGNGNTNGAAQGQAAPTDRVAATSRVADRGALEASAAMPRQLPTCR
jgi:hypothetical protein